MGRHYVTETKLTDKEIESLSTFSKQKGFSYIVLFCGFVYLHITNHNKVVAVLNIDFIATLNFHVFEYSL